MSSLPIKQYPLTTPSTGYKPFKYQWAFDFWLKQQQLHWLPEEVSFAEDVKDWKYKLNDGERSFLSYIFRFFTQGDIDVNDNYMDRYTQVFKNTEVKMMLAAFSNMETVHVHAYSLLLETVNMPSSEYTAFLDYEEMRNKHEFLGTFNVDDPLETLTTLAIFGGFVEGLQLFASFAMLLNFERFGRMKGMCQVVAWSIRDEHLHCQGISKLFREYRKETFNDVSQSILEARIKELATKAIELELAFIDAAFSQFTPEGLTKEDMQEFIKYIANVRMKGLGLPKLYPEHKNPLPWFDALVKLNEHANFFEARSTEYTKAATTGEWNYDF